MTGRAQHRATPTNATTAQGQTPTSAPRVRARIDPSLAIGNSPNSSVASSSTAHLARPASSAGISPHVSSAAATSTRPRLRSAVSSASTTSGISSISGVSASSSNVPSGSIAGQGQTRAQVHARPQSPSRREATSPGIFGGTVAGGARAKLTPTPASGYGSLVSGANGRDAKGDEETPTRIKARVTKSGASALRTGAYEGVGSLGGAGGSGAGQGSGVGSGHGQGQTPSTSGRASPIPSSGRPRIKATPTALATRTLRASSPTPTSISTSIPSQTPATPADARLRAVIAASPSVPAVSSPLSPHVGSSSSSFDDTSTSMQAHNGEPTDRRVDAERVSARGGRPLLALPLTPASNAPADGHSDFDVHSAGRAGGGPTGDTVADPSTPLRHPNPPSAIPPSISFHQYTSISAPTSPLITASISASSSSSSTLPDSSASARLTRISRDGDAYAYARQHSQTPTLERSTQARPHPLRSGTISGPHGYRTGTVTATGTGGARGRSSGRGLGPATPNSPEVHCIDLPPLTPSTSRPCYDGIETPRYPHLERGRDRSPLGVGTGGAGAIGNGAEGEGVMLGYGGGSGFGDDGGLGLAIMQGLQDVTTAGDGEADGEPRRDGYGSSDGSGSEHGHAGVTSGAEQDAPAEEGYTTGQIGPGRGSVNNRLSGSTVVGDYTSSLPEDVREGRKISGQAPEPYGTAGEGLSVQGHEAGHRIGNGLEIVDVPVSRAESESVDTSILAEGEDEEEEEDVLEARINRKVADLEISNASLMAINRSLESTKAKQRTEILRLRRQLRESLHLPPSYSFSGRPLLSPTLTSSASTSSSHPRGLNGVPLTSGTEGSGYGNGLGYGIGHGSDGEDDLDTTELDLEVEARWAAMEDLVHSMTNKAQEAVKRGREEMRPVGRMVLSMSAGEGEGEAGVADKGDLSASVSTLPGDREGGGEGQGV